MPNARVPATVFVATEITPTRVTFENPAHDFPRVTRYARTADGSLETPAGLRKGPHHSASGEL